MQGGGYGRIITNELGQFVSIQPVEQPSGTPAREGGSSDFIPEAPDSYNN
ncbi:MAG: hypothetical protein NTY03_00435 [Candidatus Bathyarchaeota archaeon]|nr:hypothetical protein [Candidatus Bathyarchaeota archaeon]